jgi:hypothetical protein
MTAKRRAAKANAESQAPAPKNNTVDLLRRKGESDGQVIARSALGPDVRHGTVHANLLHSELGNLPNAPSIADFAKAVSDIADSGAAGDLAFAGRMLAAQAVTLDNVTTEMFRRMAVNMGASLPAMEIYGRLALKAQAQSRATLEALIKLHQPREQTVRHVHVNEGGQAIIADQFHHHGPQRGGAANGQSGGQPHTQGAHGSALPCPNPLRPAVPLACDQGQSAMPDARRQRKRRA